MNEVAGGVAGEGVAVKGCGQAVAPVNRHTAGGTKLPRVQVGGRPAAGDRKDPRLLAGRRDVVDGHPEGGCGVAANVAVFQHHLHAGIAVAAEEAGAEVVDRKPELTVACDGLKAAGA